MDLCPKVRKFFFFQQTTIKRWIQNTAMKHICLFKCFCWKGKEKEFLYFYEVMLSDINMNDSIFFFFLEHHPGDMISTELRSQWEAPLTQPSSVELRANHFYLKCKWMKNIWGKKLTHRWLKAYGWLPNTDHLHALYSKDLCFKTF